jgi:hypothetical protein
MRGLSTKLLERLALSTGGTFPEFLSNAIIADNAIRAHKEGKKTKAMAAPSGSSLPKYRVVHPSHPTNPPRQHQHQHAGLPIQLSSSGPPAHIRARTSRQHQGLYHHHRMYCACMCHRHLETPLTPYASTVVILDTSLKSALVQGRTRLMATSTIHLMDNRRLSLPRQVV